MSQPHIPRKRFGQHFLKDSGVLQKIVDVFSPREGQQVLEIGPGTGALTELLLQRISTITAVELDRDLVDRLKQQYPPECLEVIQGDILALDLRSVLREKPGSGVRLIGNLPYNISTPLIFHLLQYADLVQDMLFMVQKEVALRLQAQPGHRHYGRLSVMTALALDCRCLFDVPPSAFHPPPKVDSTVIQLIPKDRRPKIDNPERFKNIVAAAFSQRRKTIRNSLKTLVTDEQLRSAGIDPHLRAENLSVSQFIDLSKV